MILKRRVLNGGLSFVPAVLELALVARVVDKLCEHDRARRRQRPPRPPEMKRTGVAMPNVLLPCGLCIDRIER